MSVQIGIAQLRLENNEIARIADLALEDVPRAGTEGAEIDLWGKNITCLPATAVPVLVHEVFCQVEWFQQIIWFNRAETHDQLWAHTDLDFEIAGTLQGLRGNARADYLAGFGNDCACVLSVPRGGTFDESLLELLCGFFSTQAGAPGDIERLIATAYINKAHFRLLLERVELHRERERLAHEEFSRQAYENETEIIHVARELGLNPEPAGTGPIQWHAKCPGKGHTLMIATSNDDFGCGYCRVNGGVDELRAFVAERRPPKDPPQTEGPAGTGEIDLSYRPQTYWPEQLDQEQLLARISGQARREIVRDALARGDIASIDPILADEELDYDDRRSWGLIHPTLMGGEFLPNLGIADVEIARISLRSTLADQTSIRAARVDEKIRYSVYDEYETEYKLAFSESELPLTLSELIELIDGSEHPEEEMPGGLLASHWKWMLDWGYALDEAIKFASIESAWYPQLTSYYEQVAADWCEAKCKERPELHDDYDEEDCA